MEPGRSNLNHRPNVTDALDANANSMLTMADKKDLEKRHQQPQRDIKRLQQVT